MVLIFFYIKEKEIFPAYISKINSNCEKEKILLIISNEEKEDDITLPQKAIFSIKRDNIIEIFIAWIVFILLEQKIYLMKRCVKKKDFCGIVMASEKDNLLEFN